MAGLSLEKASGHPYSLALGASLVLISLFYYLFHRPAFPKNAPELANDGLPLIGHLNFFTERWTWWEKARKASSTGNFSFYAGQHPVVGVSGEEGRRVFLEDKRLSFLGGYSTLLAGAPEIKKDDNKFLSEYNNDSAFATYFTKRLVAVLKGDMLRDGLPQLLKDARMMLDDLAAKPEHITDPFESVYRMVFQFTMRTVGCNEIADDQPLLAQVLKLFETIEGAVSKVGIMFPWLPDPARLKRTIAGGRLYMIFKKVVDARRQTGRRHDDALQYLIDQGDNITDMLTFVLAALFAGQLNSGINASWTLCYIAHSAEWTRRVRQEIVRVADKYCAHDASLLPLKDRLMFVPEEAWEHEFPLIDCCLRDTIRLQLSGTAFRRNMSHSDVVVNQRAGEVIPPGHYAALATGDIHYSPDIYADPDAWDPSRYFPERAEDKKVPYAFMGWGLGRHPCLGVRFAKLENNMIVAFFLAYFDVELTDAAGNVRSETVPVNRNEHTAHKPVKGMYIKYTLRED